MPWTLMCPKVLPSSSDRFILCSLSGWSCLVSQLLLSALRWQLSNQYLCFRISPQSSGSNLNAHWLFLIGYFVSNSNMLKSDFSLCKLLLLSSLFLWNRTTSYLENQVILHLSLSYTYIHQLIRWAFLHLSSINLFMPISEALS